MLIVIVMTYTCVVYRNVNKHELETYVSTFISELTTIEQTTVNKTVMVTKPTIESTIALPTKANSPINSKTVEQNDNSQKQTQPKSQPIKTNTLIHISNADVNYKSIPVNLSDNERYIIECIVTGEYGNDYVGACMIAQCIRDAIVYGHANASNVSSVMGYNGFNPNVTKIAQQAVSFIFDEGNNAVQHKMLVMYNPNICGYQSWHESCKFVTQYEQVRFFSY